ncbi:uncharacterized protein F5891DRAFT_1192665 [Suillus fuscotomentosus]|uniref:Uncharacterized protein n=1 Tax=Suillus fuscotomentosus TaxID=1912939 RepID=A0AAD4DZ42_9AGAM|nr:uncharacterized protein F5891DRAFT_1192665 [Suillus fuscotomentosus]KAG1896770.1 hypothetical protein F5891DRAFT_1192665 [Suillus fuscotomentosus]
MPTSHKKLAAARARAAQWQTQSLTSEHSNSTPTTEKPSPLLPTHAVEAPESFDIEFCPIELGLECLSDCGYMGGVSCWSDDDIIEYQPDTFSKSTLSDCESLCELEGDDLEYNLRQLTANTNSKALELTADEADTLFKIILRPTTNVIWRKAEHNRLLGYNGLSDHSRCWRDKLAQDQAEHRKKMKTSYVSIQIACDLKMCSDTYLSRDNPQVAFMQQWCVPKDSNHTPKDSNTTSDVERNTHTHSALAVDFSGYLSDESEDNFDSDTDSEHKDEYRVTGSSRDVSSHLPAVPLLKRRKLEIPFCMERKNAKERHADERRVALEAIEKLLKSKKTNFVGGPDGLQAKRTRTIQSHLALIVKRGHSSIEASERAAESHGFATVWGSHQLCSWTHNWVTKQELPRSLTGHHAKVYSLLDDPALAAELRTYVHSNKWAINPEKLAEFSKSKLIPSEAEKYLHTIVNDGMPHGLKHYMELELFPQIHLKIGRGISLVTGHRWLHREGFRYMSHRKGLYFDGTTGLMLSLIVKSISCQ